MIMRMMAALTALLLLANGPAGTGGELTVSVTNVRNGNGVVHVDLCHQTEFLKDCKLLAEAKAVVGTTIVRIPNVPPGDYGIQATHDENNNKKVDTGLFGIPKEGVGFSNDAPIGLGPPKWKDAVFAINGNKAVTLKMRYFMGARGPKN